MTDQRKPAPRPWRSFLRFSIRALIVLVLVIAAGLGWIVRQAHVQRDAVAAIKKDGGDVLYDWQWSNGAVHRGGKPWATRRLVDLIGVDYFGHVTVAALSGATDARAAMVSSLTRLEVLALNRSSVTDHGLAHLKALTRLTYLNVRHSQVTDAGVKELEQALPSLEIIR